MQGRYGSWKEVTLWSCIPHGVSQNVVATSTILSFMQVHYFTINFAYTLFYCYLQRAEIPHEGTNTPHINHDAAQEVVANQIPEQEANLNINVPNATNDSASGPTVHNMDNVANSGEYVLPVPTAPQIFPALYVVTVEELKVYKEPLSNSSVQRSLQMVK